MSGKISRREELSSSISRLGGYGLIASGVLDEMFQMADGAVAIPDEQIFPSSTERDAYFAANPNKLKDGIYTSTAGQIEKWNEVTSSYVPVTSAAGTSFSAIPDNHIPSIVAGQAQDSGVIALNNDLIIPRSVKIGTGSLQLGPNFNIANGVGAVTLKLADGTDAVSLNSTYTEAGTGDPYFYKMGPRIDFPVNTVRGITIPSPVTVSYAKQGNNLTYDLKFIPKSTGELRVRYYNSTYADPTRLIFDEKRNVTQTEVDEAVPVLFGVGNKFLLGNGENLFIQLDGIDFDGGVVPSGPLAGQLFPYFVAVVHEYRKKPFFDFGWFNYDNSVTSQAIQAGVWTTMMNDAAGINTYTQFPPDEVTRMLDPNTGRILLDQLEVGDEVYIRHTVNVIPNTNNTNFSFSHYFGNSPNAYRLPIGARRQLTEGGGVPTGDFLVDTHFFVLDENSRLNGMLPQILMDNGGTINYTGSYISVTRR